MNTERRIAYSEAVIEDLERYIATRPFGEVEWLVRRMKADARILNMPVETPAATTSRTPSGGDT